MKAKNFRRRADDVGDREDATVAVKPESSAKSSAKRDKPKEKGPSKPAAGPKLLSFADDEENVDGGDALIKCSSSKNDRKIVKAQLLSFEKDGILGDGVPSSKPKKTLQGFGSLQGSDHKLSSGKEKGATLPSNFQPQAGEYTKEKLLELQKNTIRLGGVKSQQDNKSSEPVIVLKGLVKPSVSLRSEAQAETDIPLDIKLEKADFKAREARDHLKVEKDDADSRLGLMGIGGGGEGGGITHIPDAAAIAAAKKKRERLRQAQVLPDYIPLGNSELTGGKLNDTILQGTDEALSSDDEIEIQGRIAMLGDKPSEKKKGVLDPVVEHQIVDQTFVAQRDGDEDDEEQKWEEEQLRKGVGKRVDESVSRVVLTSLAPYQESHLAAGYMPNVQPSAPLPSATWGFGGQSSEVLSVSQKAEAVMRTLQDTLFRTKETYNWTKCELNKTEENLSASLQDISTFEKSLASFGEKYIYMQKLRDYISVLCDFLKSKGPLIEELEEHMQRLHEERATAVYERRSADNADEELEVEAAINAAISSLSKGCSTSVATAAAAAAAANVLLAREESHAAVQLDEFGRDLNLQKRMEARERAQARERRKAHAAKKRAALHCLDPSRDLKLEGESSSDESDSEKNAFHSGCVEVLETAEMVFSDASEEFSQLDLVKKRLESLKISYPSAYWDAYVSLSVPSLFAPYVRLELLKWDPLYGDADFTNMKWHNLLFDYGMPENGREVSPDDVDKDLIPKLVEKVALPVLHHEVAHCWDKLSTKGTRNTVLAVQAVLTYVPPSNDALQELLVAIRSNLSAAVEDVEVPTWNRQILTVVPQATRMAAYKFGTAVRLLRNILMWKDIFATPVLDKIALDNLLVGKMLPHLRILLYSPYDAISRTERVVAALSGVWTGPNCNNGAKLEPLVDYLMSIGRSLEKRKGANAEDVAGLARRLKRMLVELNEYDRARWLLKTFQLKEAL